MGDMNSNYSFGPFLHWNQLKQKIPSKKKARRTFVLLETQEILSQQDTGHLFNPSLLWVGIVPTMCWNHCGILTQELVVYCFLIVLGHCDFHPATFSHPLEADLSKSLLSGTVFSNPNSDNYLWFCCWLERQLLGIESTFPSVQKLRVRSRGLSVTASLSNTWHQMYMWGWPSKINEFNRKEEIHTWISVKFSTNQ